MSVWDDIAALPSEELDRLMRSETRLGQRLRWVMISTVMAVREGLTPLSAEQLNAEFDARDKRQIGTPDDPNRPF